MFSTLSLCCPSFLCISPTDMIVWRSGMRWCSFAPASLPRVYAAKDFCCQTLTSWHTIQLGKPNLGSSSPSLRVHLVHIVLQSNNQAHQLNQPSNSKGKSRGCCATRRASHLRFKDFTSCHQIWAAADFFFKRKHAQMHILAPANIPKIHSGAGYPRKLSNIRKEPSQLYCDGSWWDFTIVSFITYYQHTVVVFS